MQGLNKVEERRVKAIAPFMKAEEPTLRRIGQKAFDEWATLADSTKVNAAYELIEECEAMDEVTEASALEQYEFIYDRFYSVTAAGSGVVYYLRRHPEGRADERVSVEAMQDILFNRFDHRLEPFLQIYLLAVVKSCVAREYEPMEKPLFERHYATYANTWVPPRIEPSGEVVKKRPALWQEYLDRIMPRHNRCFLFKDGEEINRSQQDYFESWIAQRVRYPHVQNTVAVVLRGHMGTGKGFWQDHMLTHLIGETNYKSVDTKDWKGDFNADLFQSVVVHLEETKDTRQNTGDMLKKLITQAHHRSNEKNVPQRHVVKHFSFTVSSNHYVPVSIEKGDRRYFVPVFSKHKLGDDPNAKAETQGFIEQFNRWLLRDDGLQVMRDWLEGLEIDPRGFMMAPDTPDKREIWLEVDIHESRESQHIPWLIARHDSKLLFSSRPLAEEWRMSETDVQSMLKKAGYRTKQLKQTIGGQQTNLNYWVPTKHWNIKAPFKNGWTVYDPRTSEHKPSFGE